MTESEQRIELENLRDLIFLNDVFEYRGLTRRYSDILHIYYSAVQTRHSINFIPTGTTYSTDLRLIFAKSGVLRINQERRFFGGQRDAFRAVARAAAIFSGITFWQRALDYERILESKGFVEWDTYQITKRGEIFFRHEQVCDLVADTHELGLRPFSVVLSKRKKDLGERFKSVWSGDHEIPISQDRDVFLYLFKNWFGITWPNEDMPEKPRPFKQEQKDSGTRGAGASRNDGRTQYLLILGLEIGASEEQIRSAYKNKVRQYHPDVLQTKGLSPDELVRAEEMLKIINHAYDQLTRNVRP